MLKDKKELLRRIMISLAEGKEKEADRLIDVFMNYIPEITVEEVTEVAQDLENKNIFKDISQHAMIEKKIFELVRDKVPQKNIAAFEEGHPIHTFLKENKVIKELVIRARKLYEVKDSFQDLHSDWLLIAKQFVSLNLHYLRKENQLFPYLEKKGFSHPSTIMWSIHDDIRKQAKNFEVAVKEKNEEEAKKILIRLASDAEEMTIKEERVLLPTAAKLLEQHEWIDIRHGEEEIGWMIETPPMWNPLWKHPSEASGHPFQDQASGSIGTGTASAIPFVSAGKKSAVGGIHLEVGSITPEQINLIFKYMPFDVTYVDEFDEVRYYNKGEDRVFPRSPGIIGRQVKYCHPPKSVHIVEKIIDAFKAGERNEANFWINFQDKFVYIQYFAVRDDEGHYKGVLEITYDAKTVRELEGEQRLLDWD